MRLSRGLRLGVCAAWLLGSGCSSLRELPRGDYAARPQRDRVRVGTVDGLVYEFDYASFGTDSLVGYRQLDVESRAAEYATLGIPLAQVTSLQVRELDWTRTLLAGGLVLVAAMAGALHRGQSGATGSGSGGGGGRPPPL